MKYKGKSIEVIGSKMLFGKETLWIHILEDDSFAQVLRSDLEEDMPETKHSGMSYVRYIAIAARIKEEMAQKRLLAPYESSLIPLPHQILVLEKVMQGVQTRFMLADEVGMGKTIEAGLVLKEKKLRGEIKRILLIVPKSDKEIREYKASELKFKPAKRKQHYKNDLSDAEIKALEELERKEGKSKLDDN